MPASFIHGLGTVLICYGWRWVWCYSTGETSTRLPFTLSRDCGIRLGVSLKFSNKSIKETNNFINKVKILFFIRFKLLEDEGHLVYFTYNLFISLLVYFMWNLLFSYLNIVYIQLLHRSSMRLLCLCPCHPLYICIRDDICIRWYIPIRMQSVQNTFYNIYFFRLDLQQVALTFFWYSLRCVHKNQYICMNSVK